MTQQSCHEPTPGPWSYVPGTENHGPYVTSQFGNTLCDCYVMSEPGWPSRADGGTSRPIPFMAEMADANACVMAAAQDMLKALKNVVDTITVQTASGSRPGRDNFNDAVRTAMAAIAKAELYKNGGK